MILLSFVALRPSFFASDGSEQVPLGAQEDSRNHRGCFVLSNKIAKPKPLGSISLEEFLAMLRFEQRHKLAELDYRDLLMKRGSGEVFNVV